MAVQEIKVQRFNIVSPNSFRDVVAALHGILGHPDIDAFTLDLSAARDNAELEHIVGKAVGPSGFMEFARFDHGAILRKCNGGQSPQILRVVLGNPIVMAQMARCVPDAGSYAPVTILIDERPDGVHLSYDRMASCLEPYGNPEALSVAHELDARIEALLMFAASHESAHLSKTA